LIWVWQRRIVTTAEPRIISPPNPPMKLKIKQIVLKTSIQNARTLKV